MLWLIIGGRYQGKKSYVKRHPLAQYASWLDGADSHQAASTEGGEGLSQWLETAQNSSAKGRLVVDHFNACLAPALDDPGLLNGLTQAIRERAAAGELFLIVDETGLGVVPLDPQQRQLRELEGRMTQVLAGMAGAVIRMFAGLPQVLKRPTSVATDRRPAFELYLVRHGATAMNRRGEYMGRTDVHLSEQGREAFEALRQTGHFPQLDLLVSSPMKRAVESAEVAWPGRPIDVLDADLIERDFGGFEGKTFEDLKDLQIYRDWIDVCGQSRTPGGESGEELSQRINAAFGRIVSRVRAERAAARAHAGTSGSVDHETGGGDLYRVGIMTHGGVILQFMKIFGFDDFYHWLLTNGSWVRLVFDAEGRLCPEAAMIGGSRIGGLV